MIEDVNALSDRDVLELLIANNRIHRIQVKTDEERAAVDRIGKTLELCQSLLPRVDELTTKLIDANDNLGMERASNKRRFTLLSDFYVLLYNHPSTYPPPLNHLVERLHKEFK